MTRRIRVVAAATTLAALAAACGGGSSPAKVTPGTRTAPNLDAFLKLPVATPSVCPANVSGSSDGRASPWVGHIDLSVFLTVGAPTPTVPKIQAAITREPFVAKIYYESSAQAYAEFQRLYTCWSEVPRSQTPASLRVVLKPTAAIAQRNTLVAQLLKTPGVDTVSCDPSLPCTTIVNSASATPQH